MTAVAKLVLQAFSTGYPPIKDMVSIMMDKAQYVQNLEDNLGKITRELVIFYSRKDQIDRQLETSESKERNAEYNILVKHFEKFLIRYNKFVGKYNKYCTNVPSFDGNVISSEVAASVLDALQERTPTILTHKFFKLAELSKEINKLSDLMSQVTEKMKQDNVLSKKAIEVVQVKHVDVDLPSSTEYYVEKILRCLLKDDNKSIGISGPIGVGKTTIMKRLNNQLKHSEKFDVVIWINYQEHHDKEKTTKVIQDAIMGRLKLDWEKANNIDQNAYIISRALWNKKYILLIDQVSSSINFDEVGIHEGHEFGKVVIASSNRKAIAPMIDHIEIKPLSENEALALFRKVCGTIKNPRIEHIEKGIVKSCGGLPLVIKLVANFLKGNEQDNEWSDVKRILQSETKAPELLKLGGIGGAYKLVYNKLEESHMKCLLFVTLFPSDYKIYKDYLVECWNAESYLDNFQELRSARDHGATVLRELTDQYLLENHSAKHVKLPVYFRKVAIELKYPGEENCLSWVPGKIQDPTEDTWKNTKMMSLICGESKIPDSPESHNMSTLLMQRKPNLVKLGNQFFLNMQNLCILDLHLTMIESLPISITSLASLICLYLNDCPQLVKLPPGIQTLKKLELLDIRGTSIPSLPIEIGHMHHLKCLRITFGQKGCNQNGKEREVGTMIPFGIIGCLHHLEELTIEVGCCSQAWTDIVDGIVTELTSLTKLSTLNFHFPRVSSLEKFVKKSKCLNNLNSHWMTNTLRSFNISVGCCKMQHSYALDVSEISAERQLRLSTKEKISSVGEVLRQTSSFELVNHCGVMSLSDFNLKNFGTLEVCVVKCCNNMMSVVDVPEINEMQMDKGNDDCAILWYLEKLHLLDLPSLQSIWKGPVFSGSFANLKVLTLVDCPKLTEILTYEQAKSLSSLEHMKVENCPQVVEIIKEVSEDINPSDILNKVMTIEFVDLLGLKHICRSTSIKWRSLVKIAIIRCNSLSLSDLQMTLSNAEKLEEIKCDESWSTKLQFPKDVKHLRCDSINTEQNSAIQVYHEGESSRSGIPNNHLPSNVIVSGNDGQEMERNGKNLLTPNTNYEEEITYHQDAPESSQQEDRIIPQSTNTNGALSIPEEKSSKTVLSISSH